MPYAYPATSILCEPAQSKCTWTCHKRHFVQKITGKMPDPYPAASIVCEPAQSKCTWTCHKRHFVRKFTGKMPDANPGASILCEPAHSKCTWTCHKRHFVRKFTGKLADASDTTSIERAFTPTVRTPQCGHTWTHCLGNDNEPNSACRMPVHWAVRPVRLLSPKWTPTPVKTAEHGGCRLGCTWDAIINH